MDRFFPIESTKIIDDLKDEYIQALINSGHAKMRFADVYPLTLFNIRHHFFINHNLINFIFDDKEKRICGEITLNCGVAGTAFAHFSIHPSYINSKFISVYTETVDWFMNYGTLIAWIPEVNKPAINFIQKYLGFTYQCDIKNGAYFAEKQEFEDCKQFIKFVGE